MPAYVRINGVSRGASLDLSAVLDISEEGIGVQAPLALERERTLAIDLDLAATRSCLHLVGQVVWAESSGRAGLQFASLDSTSAHQLREWLLLNAVAQFTGVPNSEEKLGVSSPASAEAVEPAAELFPDEEGSAFSPFQEATSSLVNRALAFTGANGAALALYNSGELICRATCGTDTPGLGSRIAVESGITGECVRNARPLICTDASTDPRVDHEICAQLGIRSILAVPLRVEDKVVGLLEVFSPRLSAFVPLDAEAMLQSSRPVLDLLFAATEKKGAQSESAPVPTALSHAEMEPVAVVGSVPEIHQVPFLPRPAPEYGDTPLYRRVAYAAAAVIIILAIGWLVVSQGSMLASLWRRKAKETPSPALVAAEQAMASSTPQLPGPQLKVSDLPGLNLLRRQAAQGDARAQFSLGAKYAGGEDGLQQDYPEAVRWFTKSAEQGNTLAQATLGAYYWAARGVPQDLQQAYFWSMLADAGGDKGSKYRLEVLRQRMTHSEVLEAQQRAQDWLARRKVPQASAQTALPQ